MAKKKVGVFRFLGTNCDRDIWKAVEQVGSVPEWIWYEDHFESDQYQALILPGGFSYGDYIRSGALASRAPAIDDLKKAVSKGIPVLGICNGFQILCEAGLLPGALLRNENPRFIDDWVELEMVNESPFWGIDADKVSISHCPR
ncbi:MAG: phosphoribosylformylglycinamidine synthase subunit PurQ [Bdellovibrionales bacterium]